MVDLEEKVELPQPFMNLLNSADFGVDGDVDVDGSDEKLDPSASTLNPNVNDNRRLFQEHRSNLLDWDCTIPVEQQPNLLEEYGPEPLQ